MNKHHRIAVLTVIAAVALDLLFGVAFTAAEHVSIGDGLYFATATATTVGYGDITPHGWLPHLLAIGMMCTVIPLFAASFSLVTSGLAATSVAASEHRVKAHLEARLRHHLGGAHEPQE